MTAFRFLHTSDWHLGRTFSGIDRNSDFQSFLAWLLQIIEEKAIDVLLVAGDIFDTTMPSTDAQRLYYDFLRRISDTHLKACVITAGNHDSQRFLSAPKDLLAAFRIYIAGDAVKDEAIVLRDTDGKAYAAIAAVPWLKEGLLFQTEENLADEERGKRWEKGVAARYAAVHKALREELGTAQVPMIAMGHLFVTNKATPNADLYVGSLRNIPASAFGAWDYIALGHIHTPLHLSDAPSPTYYCGSPLKLDFGDNSPKQVLIGTFAENQLKEIEKIPVPQPRALLQLQAASIEELTKKISQAALEHPSAIVECILTGHADQRQTLLDAVEKAVKNTSLNVAAIRLCPTETIPAEANIVQENRAVKDLEKEQIFHALLQKNGVPAEEQPKLFNALLDVYEETSIDQAQEESTKQ